MKGIGKKGEIEGKVDEWKWKEWKEWGIGQSQPKSPPPPFQKRNSSFEPTGNRVHSSLMKEEHDRPLTIIPCSPRRRRGRVGEIKYNPPLFSASRRGNKKSRVEGSSRLKGTGDGSWQKTPKIGDSQHLSSPSIFHVPTDFIRESFCDTNKTVNSKLSALKRQ